MHPSDFVAALRQALHARYGKLPSAQRLVDDLFKASQGACALSAEAARKWLQGKSMPQAVAFLYLERLLGLSAYLTAVLTDKAAGGAGLAGSPSALKVSPRRRAAEAARSRGASV